jgi:hypothetical protein
MKFSILHTSARPDRWREIYSAWLDAADHPEEVEYVLVCDRRWSFDKLPEWRVGSNFKALWNTGRRCYVDGVNIAAAYAEGDVLIVNADDQYPCEHWDTELLKVILDPTYTVEACLASDFVVEVSTNTPAELERGISVMPILSRARYEQLGYVFYPAYESMYADNDFFEKARADNRNPRPDGALYSGDDVRGIVLNARHLTFPHRHPLIEPALEWDQAYQEQNRRPAYERGAAVLAARRESDFGRLGEVRVQERPEPTTRQKLTILFPGEIFSSAVFGAGLSIQSEAEQLFHVEVLFGHSSNVYLTRQAMADGVIATKPDLVLWIDDDQVLTLDGFRLLLADLRAHPELDAVVGWAWCFPNIYGNEAKLSCGTTSEGQDRRMQYAELMAGEDDLKPVSFSGFPAMLMRGAFLEKMGPRSFLPLFDEERFPPWGMSGEDAAFTIRARERGFQIAVDRRVKVPHLKLRCAEPIEQTSLAEVVGAPAKTGA